MSFLKKVKDALSPRPKSPEDLAAQAEALRVRDEMETARLSQRSQAGQNYQSGRGSRQ
jgi:hypothetical protein